MLNCDIGVEENETKPFGTCRLQDHYRAMNLSDSLKPTSITADRNTRQIHVTWIDGHESDYPFSLVRAACPCATCRGGHEYMSAEPDPEVFRIELPESPATRMVKIEPVGSYAMTIEWEDGHHYGIYHWHYLRALCPCQTCRQE
ncbi:MAG TPA: DUF971 domain-containing protein [Anaerolineaceae bacterium]|nr:DUF971 domain-containing protein [Anaerolineaceae bacterium]